MATDATGDAAGVDEVTLSASRTLRAVYGALGFLFLGLGIAGIFIPVLPTTINVILAAFFFFRSNERMYRWLIEHPRFGPALRDYRAGLGIPRRVKMFAVGLIAVTFATSMYFAVTSVRGRVIMIATAVAISAYILSRPTKEKVLAERASPGGEAVLG